MKIHGEFYKIVLSLNLSKWFIFRTVFQLFVSIGLIATLMKIAEASFFKRILESNELLFVLSAVPCLFAVQIILVSLRLKLLAASACLDISLVKIIKIQFGAVFLAQVTPVNIGGDIYAWSELTSISKKKLLSATIIMFDKIVALIGVVALTVALYLVIDTQNPLILYKLKTQVKNSILLVPWDGLTTSFLVFVFLCLISFFVFRYKISSFSQKFYHAVIQYTSFELFRIRFLYFLFSCFVSIVSALNLVMLIYCLSVMFVTDISLPGLGFIFLCSQIIGLLPVSFAGWGMRELTFMYGLQAFQISSSDAIHLSFSYGLALLLCSLPSAAFLVISWFRK